MSNDLTEGNGNSSPSTQSPRQPNFDTPPISQDNVFNALASKRSRYVLVAVREADEPLELRELVDIVASWETDKPIDLVSDEHRKRVFTSLRHSKLPKLARMGLVEYDEANSRVVRGPHAEQADAYLDIAVSRDENLDV